VRWLDLKPGDVVMSPDGPDDPSVTLLVLANDGRAIAWLNLESGEPVAGGAYRWDEVVSPHLIVAASEGG